MGSEMCIRDRRVHDIAHPARSYGLLHPICIQALAALIIEPVPPEPSHEPAHELPRATACTGGPAMTYSVAQAAKAIGKSKHTVLRGIASGKISATRDPATGAYRIEPSELHRVFAPAAEAVHEPVQKVSDETIRAAVLQAQLGEKETLIAVLERTNADLRARLDLAAAQLGEALAQVRALTDQRSAPLARRWWRWRS